MFPEAFIKKGAATQATGAKRTKQLIDQLKDSKEDKADEKEKDSLEDIVFKAKLDFLAGLRKNSTKAEEYEDLLDALKSINSVVTDILDVLKEQRAIDKKKADQDRKNAEVEKKRKPINKSSGDRLLRWREGGIQSRAFLQAVH